MNGIKKVLYTVTVVLWLSALFGGLWFAGVFSIGGKSGLYDAAEELAAETGNDRPPVWTVVFKGMKFVLPQKGKVYLHESGCMNIRQDERYLIQIDIEENTLDEMWSDMEQKRESLIKSGYCMEKEAERVTGEGYDYIRYVLSLKDERGSDLDQTFFEVLLASADEERHFLVVILYDEIDVEKLDDTMREKIYDEALVRAKGIWEGACRTDEADDEVGMLFTEDKSLNPDQRYILEDTLVYGDGEHSLSYRLPEHCMLTLDNIAGKTYYDEDNQAYIQTNVVKYTWLTAREMAESVADRELSRPLTSGELKVSGRTFYYYTYSVAEYGRNKTSLVYEFHGYCDLEDGSIYSIFGYADDNPEAADEAYYLEWMDITVL